MTAFFSLNCEMLSSVDREVSSGVNILLTDLFQVTFPESLHAPAPELLKTGCGGRGRGQGDPAEPGQQPSPRQGTTESAAQASRVLVL